MSHANAALTPRARLRLAKLIVEEHWSATVAAKMFMTSPPTARKWGARFRVEGAAGMLDRSSRPRSMPTKTPPELVKRIVKARWRRRLGPAQIAAELGLPTSTVHAVLVRARINRLSHIDRVTGEPIRRYEHPHPGSMIHVDVTKFGSIPDGGGWRFVGKQQGDKHKATTALRTGRTSKGHPNIGTAFVHTVIDDYSRVAYAEICADEKAVTAIGVLERAVAWRRSRRHSRARLIRQRVGLSLLRMARCLHPARRPTQAHPPLSSTDQWQDRAVPPHPRRRLGLRTLLRIRIRTPSRATRLATHLQSSQAPLRSRSRTHQQTQQPAWTSHLGVGVGSG